MLKKHLTYSKECLRQQIDAKKAFNLLKRMYKTTNLQINKMYTVYTKII